MRAMSVCRFPRLVFALLFLLACITGCATGPTPGGLAPMSIARVESLIVRMTVEEKSAS